MLKEHIKKFYRNLYIKNIEIREPPSMAEARTYWMSLWGEEAQHNGRAEWIRREQKVDNRPITCLTTMYKTLKGIIDKRMSP